MTLRGEPAHHGTRYVYRFYGCRCEACSAAALAYGRAYREQHRLEFRERHRIYMRAYRKLHPRSRKAA